jgi:hypothetical protein
MCKLIKWNIGIGGICDIRPELVSLLVNERPKTRFLTYLRDSNLRGRIKFKFLQNYRIHSRKKEKVIFLIFFPKVFLTYAILMLKWELVLFVPFVTSGPELFDHIVKKKCRKSILFSPILKLPGPITKNPP